MKGFLFIFFFLFSQSIFAQSADSLKIALQIDSLITLNRNYVKEEKWDEAFQAIKQAKQMAVNAFGEVHYLSGKATFGQARTYNKMKKYNEAEEYFLYAVNLMEQVLGKENVEYTHVLRGVAGFYKEWGKFESAEKLYLESKKYRKNILSTQHPLYASSLNNLAALYYEFGYYEKAENFYKEAIIIYKKALPNSYSKYANTLNNLAILYTSLGLYEQAEALFIESKDIRERILGKKHPDYANSLGNLGGLYFKLRLYEKAETMFLESKDIREATIGQEHPEYLATVMNLAVVYKEKGQYEKAKLLNNENLVLIEKVYNKVHPKYALHLNGLGNVYNELRDYEKAKDYYLESLNVRKKVLGENHPDYIQSLHNLAILHYRKKEYKMADSLFQESKAIRERIFGKDHPGYISSLNNLTSLNETLERFELTENNFAEISDLQQSHLKKVISFLSEKELSEFTQEFVDNGAKMMSFTLERKTRNINLGQLPELCYDHMLFYKGFLLNSTLQLNKLISDSLKTIELNDELKSYRRRLARLYSKTIQERDSLLVAELEEKANMTEKRLTREVFGYGDALKQFNWKDVQNALKKGEASIEFVHYKKDHPNETDSLMYAALLLLPDSQQPHYIPLFEEKEIHRFFPANEKTGNIEFLKINAIYDFDQKNLKNLYDLIWKPIAPYLKNTDRIFYSPSGLLHKVAFAALPISEKKRLIDEYDLQLVASTSDIVNQNSRISNISSVTMYGDMAFSGKSKNHRSIRGVIKCALFGDGGKIDSLPGSRKEVEFLQKLFTKNGLSEIEVKVRMEASEASFKAVDTVAYSPSIIHISTHGFFYEASDINTLNCTDSINTNWEAIITSENPLLRSGLLMSEVDNLEQVKDTTATIEDGILTALEIANVDLSNTQLVVLSACETGLGDIAEQEGVYGLQRAFKIAGVNQLLMTLWKVDDNITNLFMQSFYTKLLEGSPSEAALRQAQNEVRKEYPHPFYWAGFILL